MRIMHLLTKALIVILVVAIPTGGLVAVTALQAGAYTSSDFPPHYPGISNDAYGAAAFVCAEGQTAHIAWMSNYKTHGISLPNLRACIDVGLMFVDHNPEGWVDYGHDLYTHYWAEQYMQGLFNQYVKGVAYFLSVYAKGNWFLTEQAVCASIGVGLSEIKAAVVTTACGFATGAHDLLRMD